MRRVLTAILILLAVAGGAYLAMRGSERATPVLRGPLEVPRPTPAEKLAYFYRLFTSGEQAQMGGRRLPVWQVIGERALVAMGGPAMDFLLSPERMPEYRAAPSILSNVLRVLRDWPESYGHEGLYPLLLYWLDPAHKPPTTTGSDWAKDIRLKIFTIFVLAPDARAVPACVEELKRGKHEPDLRAPAIAALLEGGEGANLRDLYAGLPPNQMEPDTFHRFLITKRAYAFASPSRSQRMRDQIKALEPALRGALESEHEIERIYAAASLLTLGDDSMETYLLREFERDQEAAAWDAIRLLALHNGSPKARELCLKELDVGERRVGFYTALDLLGKVWISEPGVRRRVEGFLRDSTWREDGRLLQRLIRVDRPLILDFLHEQIESGDPGRIHAAVEYVQKDAVREAVPWLLELLHKSASERERLYYYRALVALRSSDALPMLRAELVEAENREIRDLAITAILGTSDRAGLEELAELLGEGERLVLDALGARALSHGRDGVPDELVPALLTGVRELAGEDGRIQALWILRGRGILDRTVEEGLKEAYRREPSERVAGEIDRALEELAHR
ncbi:MAG: hypothetical protein ACYSX0_04920 [Planctomycetota bacterium]|jgi:hypothetical protein